MAHPEHLEILRNGIEGWNEWRIENPAIEPDLSEIDLSGIDLSLESHLANLYRKEHLGIRFHKQLQREREMHKSMLRRRLSRGSDSFGINLSKTNLFRTNLSGANLYKADLSRTNLIEANLRCAFLSESNLSNADLIGSDLGRATLTGANLSGANLTNCFIYAISAWDVQLENTNQSNLIITRPFQPSITVDNLEVAQFIYLILNNKKIRHVIDTINSKLVLILGRFTKERKEVLDAIRDELRDRNYLPVIFDFEKPKNLSLTATVSTLAHIAHFIIVDLTDPSSAPHEMATIVPHCIIPVQPLILKGKHEYAMFRDLRLSYHWVLPPYRYQDIPSLITSMTKHVIEPAEQKAKELNRRKQEV